MFNYLLMNGVMNIIIFQEVDCYYKKLFIASGKDEITPLHNIEEFISGQKNFNLKVFDNAYAKSILSNPDEYEKLINIFLDDIN